MLLPRIARGDPPTGGAERIALDDSGIKIANESFARETQAGDLVQRGRLGEKAIEGCDEVRAGGRTGELRRGEWTGEQLEQHHAVEERQPGKLGLRQQACEAMIGVRRVFRGGLEIPDLWRTVVPFRS